MDPLERYLQPPVSCLLLRHPARGRLVLSRMPRSPISRPSAPLALLLLATIGMLLESASVQAAYPIDPVRSGYSMLSGYPRRSTSRIKRSNNTYGSHYFLSFTAIPLKKRSGFYKNTMVSLSTVAYGLTNNLSVAGSLDLVSLIRSRARAGGPIYSGRAQVCGSVSDVVHIGVSATYVNTKVPVGVEVPDGVDLPAGFTAGMGMLTLGSKNNQITVAGGYTYNGKELSRAPVFNLGGAARAFTNVMIITEHWIFSDPDKSFMTHSFGIRVLGDNLAIDVGVVYDKEYTKKISPVGLPFLSATLNF